MPAAKDSADFTVENKYILRSLLIAFTSLLVGALFGVLQALERVPGVSIISSKLYYLSLTGHGVLMALVFTTFFIMGIGIYAVTRSLGVPLASYRLNSLAYWLAIGGTVMATLAILSGRANVLYTFYPPMRATTFFYLGATILVVGTWLYSLNIFLTAREWIKAGNRGMNLPLPTYGIVVTLIVWIMATVGLAAEVLLMLIPWSLGIVDRIDPLLARTLFWFFGHPLVYFLLLPAYVVWYTVLPRVLNTTVFSEKLSRLAFTLFVLFSVPVGFHHQFMDPGISQGWKFLHTVLTFFVFVPSLMTAFTITATMEKSARQQGGAGLLAWLGKLPWRDPTFTAIFLAMVSFAFGGAGGAVNAGLNVNAAIHNTAWIPGHLHLTAGTAVALTFMGVSYLILPRLTGRAPLGRGLALTQVYLWFVGVAIFSTAMHVAGILGSPRRASDVTYEVAAGAPDWGPYMTVAGVGGVIMFSSVVLFVVNMVLLLRRRGRVGISPPIWEKYEPTPREGILDNLKVWVIAAVVLILIAYAVPTLNIVRMDTPGAPPLSIR